ncbi:MAG: plasminogen-binding N-terminal domain-containing protein [Sulfurovum sp.]
MNRKKMENLPQKGKFPFFSRLEKIESGWFDTGNNEKDYYRTMEQL